MPGLVLLDSAANLVEGLVAQPDHVEGVQHGDRVREAVMDGVRIPTEGVEGSRFDAVDEPVGLVTEPSFVDRAGAADDRV